MATDVDAVLKLQQRTVIGKGLNGLRGDGMVPAVIHNHGQASIHVLGPERELSKVYRVAGKHHPLQLQVEDQDFLALIKDVHFNPVRRRMEHVVFQAIKRDEKVEAEIPIRLDGEIPAEKVGLMILHQLDHVEVEALPGNLPDELVADATVLAEIGDKITIADLPIPEDVTILTEADHPIATVIETKAMMSDIDEAPAEEAVEGEEGAEPAEGEAEAGESAGAENTSENEQQ